MEHKGDVMNKEGQQNGIVYGTGVPQISIMDSGVKVALNRNITCASVGILDLIFIHHVP